MKEDLSRRKFLLRSAGATGALAASPRVFLEPEHIPLPWQSTPPSDRVRFGIIGIGMQGSGLLTNAVQLPGVECVAAADLLVPLQSRLFLEELGRFLTNDHTGGHCIPGGHTRHDRAVRYAQIVEMQRCRTSLAVPGHPRSGRYMSGMCQWATLCSCFLTRFEERDAG